MRFCMICECEAEDAFCRQSQCMNCCHAKQRSIEKSMKWYFDSCCVCIAQTQTTGRGVGQGLKGTKVRHVSRS